MQGLTTNQKTKKLAPWLFFGNEKRSLKFLLLSVILLFSSNIFAQYNNTEEIQQIDEQIESIRIKRDLVKNSPEEDSIAITQNWYILMDKQLAQLTAKKRKIIMDQTGKKWVSIEEFNDAPEKKKMILLSDDSYIIETELE